MYKRQDKYSGFGLGADDYITKPFMPKELIFRLNAVLRRCYKEDKVTYPNTVISADIRVNCKALYDCPIDFPESNKPSIFRGTIDL